MKPGQYYALTNEVTVQEAGYPYIFLSNEHPTYVDVYFDDVTVSQTISPIVASSDYSSQSKKQHLSRLKSIIGNFTKNTRELQPYD